MMLFIRLVFATILCLGSFYVSAERLHYTVEIPPKTEFKLKRVGFYVLGNDANNLASMLGTSLSSRGVEVVSNLGVSSIVRNSGLRYSSDVHEQLKGALGDSGLFVIRTLASRSDRTRSSDKDKDGKYTYYAKTRYYLTMSVQLQDLTTRKMDKVLRYEESIEESDWSYSYGGAEYPSSAPLTSKLLKRISNRIVSHYFPRTEKHRIAFYADKYFDSKKSYKAFKKDRKEEGLSITAASVEMAKTSDVKPKHIAKAYHNYGIALFLTGDFDKALEQLDEARSIKDERTFRKSIKKIEEAKTYRDALQRWNTSSVMVGSDAPLPEVKNVAVESPSNNDLNEDEIIAKLKKYKKLLDQGLINQEAYDKKSAPLIEMLD